MTRRLGSVSEPLAVGLGTLAVLGAYAWIARYGIDLVDEGYFLDLASRVQHGQLPYRDFDTYYTPGLFYVQAAALALFGPNVLVSRALMVGLRVACGLLLYTLARRVASPAFAAVPALVLAATGLLVGSSPGWPALACTLLMLETIACHRPARTRTRWLALAGAAAGLAFAFKQNVGAFALLGALGYVLLRERPGAGGLVLGLRLLYAGGLAWIVGSFLSPALDERLGAAVWLPLVLTLGLLVARAGASSGASPRLAGGLRALVVETGWLSAGYGLITLVWLLPLIAALGPRETPFELFLGSAVKQGALTFSLEPPPRGAGAVGLAAVWAPLAVAFICGPSRSRLVWPAAVAAQVSLVIAWLPTPGPSADTIGPPPGQLPRLETLYLDLGSLYLYLPALAAWSGLLLLVRRLRGHPPLVPWYLLVGALAELAFYPRSDTPHAVLAGAPLLVVGAWGLARIHTALAGGASRLGRAAVFAALLLVPTAAVVPHAYGTYFGLMYPALRAEYIPVRLERAPVLELRDEARAIEQAIAFLQERTSPGEPIFAYPVDPLVNFLADRPNPTRFDHLMPGALSAADMQEAIASLEAARPRYVFWDHGAVVFWGADEPNRPLSDYIWRCYQHVATFHLYLVLERTAC